MGQTMKTYRIVTFGCQMNEHDSETLAGILENMGYVPADSEVADVILFNTCCVRENAARRLYGHVASLKWVKKERPGAVIGICGCLPQQPGEIEHLMRDLPHVNLVFGTHNLFRLPELIARVIEQGPVCEVGEDDATAKREGLPVRRASMLKAWVTIMYGCNNFCSYCIVPYVRGRESSRKLSDILHEVGGLASEGTREVTLLGQNVNSYGKDLDEPVDFADLLSSVNGVPGLARIRFQTSHPRDVTDRLIAVMAGAKKVCEHLHLPMQAGSTEVLALMNRGYSAEHYLNIVQRLRAHIPSISLTTDIIVGFPGETEHDFQETMAVVREVGFDSAFTFAYSPRRGTPASEMPGQVAEPDKMRRLQELIDLQNTISLEHNRNEVGALHEVLVEGPSQREEPIWVGRTRTNKMVHFPRREGLEPGQLVTTRITEGQTHTLYGQLVDPETSR